MFLPAVFAVLLAVTLVRAAPVVAAGVVGSGTPGSCSEAALDAALAGGGMVTFDCGSDPVGITITSTKAIVADTTIDGGRLITISGGDSVRVFFVDTSVIFTVENLTIANGMPANGEIGGGIRNDGTLVVTNGTFSGNSASNGGGIFNNWGSLTVTNSTFSGNTADSDGGGILNWGALIVTNSTFSGNSAGHNGGGIFDLGITLLVVTTSTFSGNSAGYGGGGIDNGGRLTVTNSTFSGNSAGAGGGIANSDFGTVTVTNTIVAGSTSDGSCYGAITDGGHNIDDGTTCGFAGTGCTTTSGSSFCRTDPELDPGGLADNGGPTQTIALQAGSPAINAGDQSVCANLPVNGLDQCGFVRPGIGHTACSIGAYEADAVAAEACAGDCDGNGLVAITDLIMGVNIVLAIQPVEACPAFANSPEMVDIAQLVTGVNNALGGCNAD